MVRGSADQEATRFDPVICADPEQAHVSIRKGNALGTLDRDEEARCGAVSPGDSAPVVMIGADRSHFTPFPTFADALAAVQGHRQKWEIH